MKKVRGTAKANMALAKNEFKDLSVTLSAMIVQIFHERINKLKNLQKKKNEKKT